MSIAFFPLGDNLRGTHQLTTEHIHRETPLSYHPGNAFEFYNRPARITM
jgi:hypothetical protein